jgi:hypothetical protein
MFIVEREEIVCCAYLVLVMGSCKNRGLLFEIFDAYREIDSNTYRKKCLLSLPTSQCFSLRG